MTTKIIQVPVDQQLLAELNKACKKQKKKRAEFVRQACRESLKRLQEAEWDRQYIEGYKRIPETTEFADSVAKMAHEIFPEEKW